MRPKAMSMKSTEMPKKGRTKKVMVAGESMAMAVKDEAMIPAMEMTSPKAITKEATMSAKEKMMTMQKTSDISAKLDTLGRFVTRYGLVVVLGWIGALKFTGYEAEGIQPLVANSPLLGWTYNLFSVQALSNLIGLTEIIAALLIAIRPLSGKISAIGSVLAIGTFLTTLTFILSTPGEAVYVKDAGGLTGFPYLSVLPGQFLLKDFVLLGASIWTLADSLRNRA